MWSRLLGKSRRDTGKARNGVTGDELFPPGHYYSAIPDKKEVFSYLNSRNMSPQQLPGIQLNEKKQYRLLCEYSHYYGDLPFPETRQPDCRYYYTNEWFSYGDAIFLYSFLRKHEPRQIIEIGSGFSSALILDTVERFFSNHPRITFIEPEPLRLFSLLREGDREKVNLVLAKVQQVPSRFFLLSSGWGLAVY